ncbi:16S rRNA (guanine(966)-N(2))-methyltransferase RsmD [Salipaludibacillus sp. LMS25]|jgi:16S rRNA (guanine(966)-N(2))-methyltransferase RsmD|uniref:16S rRNA (guanine(966)-N(2))-methyltransferase RsmD n=1 Tax=Salipaludibacillus sp. LMS25 TaxID=2924031 RepID=UPI0020D1D526|nr:16S rRNA (guanine(966)-N(2))-methyltransferase RsmD [Salipaludibacillus sp. LMS25]UTR15207.1 16S rRNA (guanine(966)-N(2))-methyltransferase RsmD [Salipaludibacillus sp. LMS25]
MRVISGKQKGISLKSVPGHSTRPTTDKVKEAIFNMVGPYFNGGVMLDLYAGSGAMGIEALSRGMSKAVFVDKDRKAIETIYANLKTVTCLEKAEVYKNEAKRALNAIRKKGRQFDLIFLDPPYAKQTLADELASIDEYNVLLQGGYIVAEHSSKVVLDNRYQTFVKTKEERYGDTSVSIFKSLASEERI